MKNVEDMSRGECISEIRQMLGSQVEVLLAGRHKIVIYNNETGNKEIADPREFVKRCRDEEILIPPSVFVKFYNEFLGTSLGSIEEVNRFIIDNPAEHDRFVKFMEAGHSPNTVQ